MYKQIQFQHAALFATFISVASSVVIAAGVEHSPAAWQHTVSSTATPPADNNVADLIHDQPGYAESSLNYSQQALKWTWDALYDNVLYWVLPSTARLKKAVAKSNDADDLFMLLENAGYTIQSIDNDIGIIPDTVFTFSQARELSEADYDYLDVLADDLSRKHTGLTSKLKRAILNTVVAINLSSDYQVSSLELEVLPLPNVAFTVSPKASALGRENSKLMGALQRLDRRVLSQAN